VVIGSLDGLGGEGGVLKVYCGQWSEGRGQKTEEKPHDERRKDTIQTEEKRISHG
jgi:hypothetical protein